MTFGQPQDRKEWAGGDLAYHERHCNDGRDPGQSDVNRGASQAVRGRRLVHRRAHQGPSCRRNPRAGEAAEKLTGTAARLKEVGQGSGHQRAAAETQKRAQRSRLRRPARTQWEHLESNDYWQQQILTLGRGSGMGTGAHLRKARGPLANGSATSNRGRVRRFGQHPACDARRPSRIPCGRVRSSVRVWLADAGRRCCRSW